MPPTLGRPRLTRSIEGVATLYDSLLDELEDDVVSNPQDVEDLTVKVVDAEEADADMLVDDEPGVLAEGDIEAEAEAAIRALKPSRITARQKVITAESQHRKDT